MTLTYEAALDLERRKVAAQSAHHAREARRSGGVSWGGMEPAHYLPPTEAEMERAAWERVQGWHSEEAVLKRALIGLCAAGDAEAYAALAACDRGDAGCWERAAEIVARAGKAAA